jgi:pimeloyl-ACP methyl ester carboxylesterase
MTHRALTSFRADDGERIHLAIAGAGDPVVMLHGWTASHEEWFPFLDQLTPHHRVYRWDARGHGGHGLITGTLPTVQRMARDLRNLLQHYNLAGATLVGHSMGALTVWEYIRHYGTSALGRACLIDQSPRLLTADDWEHGIYGDFDEARSRRFIAELEDDFAEAVLRLGAYGLNTRARAKYEQNARGWQRVREGLKQLNPAPLIETWKSLTAADYRDVLERIDIPALLIYGGESNFYHAGTARYVHERMPQATLRIYEGTDHSPHQWQRERFAQDLLAFIGAASAGRPASECDGR